MNIKDTPNRFKVVLSVGDESGIGPEIILKALCSDEIPKDIEFTLVGSKKNLQNTYSHLKSLGLKKIRYFQEFMLLILLMQLSIYYKIKIP